LGRGLYLFRAAPSELIRSQRFLDGNSHHHHAKNNHRAYDNLGSSQDTETDAKGSRAR
jgi:hypothetical protein